MKYTLSEDETKEAHGHTLHRVLYADGRKGGWIERESNLSQEGECVVLDEACVFDDGSVYGDAVVCGSALVLFYAAVYGHAIVKDNAVISGWSRVLGSAIVGGSAKVFDHARVFGYAHADGRVRVHERAYLYGHCRVWEDAEVCGSADVRDDARVYGKSVVSGCGVVQDKASVHDCARVSLCGEACGDIEVCGTCELLTGKFGGRFTDGVLGDVIPFVYEPTREVVVYDCRAYRIVHGGHRYPPDTYTFEYSSDFSEMYRKCDLYPHDISQYPTRGLYEEYEIISSAPEWWSECEDEE